MTFHMLSNMIELSDLEDAAMLEMELKARLKNKEGVIKYLSKQGCVWGNSVAQEDVI